MGKDKSKSINPKNAKRLPVVSAKTEVSRTSESKERFSEQELAEMRKGIGNRIKETYDTDNASKVARSLATAPNVARNWMDGDRFPAPEFLILFRRKTGVSLDWLMTGEGSRQINMKPVFSAEEENRINELALLSGRSFLEEVRRLALAGLSALEKYQS